MVRRMSRKMHGGQMNQNTIRSVLTPAEEQKIVQDTIAQLGGQSVENSARLEQELAAQLGGQSWRRRKVPVRKVVRTIKKTVQRKVRAKKTRTAAMVAKLAAKRARTVAAMRPGPAKDRALRMMAQATQKGALAQQSLAGCQRGGQAAEVAANKSANSMNALSQALANAAGAPARGGWSMFGGDSTDEFAKAVLAADVSAPMAGGWSMFGGDSTDEFAKAVLAADVSGPMAGGQGTPQDQAIVAAADAAVRDAEAAAAAAEKSAALPPTVGGRRRTRRY